MLTRTNFGTNLIDLKSEVSIGCGSTMNSFATKKHQSSNVTELMVMTTIGCCWSLTEIVTMSAAGWTIESGCCYCYYAMSVKKMAESKTDAASTMKNFGTNWTDLKSEVSIGCGSTMNSFATKKHQSSNVTGLMACLKNASGLMNPGDCLTIWSSMQATFLNSNYGWSN